MPPRAELRSRSCRDRGRKEAGLTGSVGLELALESDEPPPRRKSRPKNPVSSPQAGVSPSRQDDETERSQ